MIVTLHGAFCLIAFIGFEASATITQGSGYTVVKVGDSTLLPCSVSPPDDCILWTYFPPGADQRYSQSDKNIYDCESGVRGNFNGRFTVDRNITTGNANLHIKEVAIGDAGTYACHGLNGYGQQRSEELFVIGDEPICNSSVSLQEIIAPNPCCTPPDEIRLTCSVRYIGSADSHPILEWRRVGYNQKLHQTCENVGDRVNCTFMLNASLHLSASSYICTTTQSATTQYNCTTESLNILNLFRNSSAEYAYWKNSRFLSSGSTKSLTTSLLVFSLMKSIVLRSFHH